MEVLRQTCAFYRALRDRGTPVPCFSVNLSRLDFSRGGDVGPWYTARVSRIPASTERAYLLTIQSHPANEARYLDAIARDYPEILE